MVEYINNEVLVAGWEISLPPRKSPDAGGLEVSQHSDRLSCYPSGLYPGRILQVNMHAGHYTLKQTVM